MRTAEGSTAHIESLHFPYSSNRYLRIMEIKSYGCFLCVLWSGDHFEG